MSGPVLFQALPPLSPEEYAALEASIREHGIQVPILVDENKTVIDGHHRQKIAAELGIECPRKFVFDKTEAEKRTLALSLNIDRRHLTREQKRALVAESIKADPELPDLQHAKRTGVSPTTVGTVRSHLEATGDVSKLETRTDSLGRQQPAAKSERPPANVNPDTGEIEDPMPTAVATRPPASPKYGGNRRKHAEQINALIIALSGALLAFEDVTELDKSVTTEEATRLMGDLSRQIQSLKDLHSLIKERTK